MADRGSDISLQRKILAIIGGLKRQAGERRALTTVEAGVKTVERHLMVKALESLLMCLLQYRESS